MQGDHFASCENIVSRSLARPRLHPPPHSWVIIAASSITKKYRYIRYDTYRIFYIPVNFAFNYHIMLPATCATQVKKSKKGILKTENKNKVRKNLLQGVLNPDPQNQLELKVNASIHWTMSVNADHPSLVYSPSLW